jgi:hypothetical protein
MIQSINQLELGLRVKTLKEAVEACRARQEQVKQEEAEYMDQLAQAEAEVTGKAPGSEGVELSGLIPEGENPYAQATEQPPAEGEQEPEPEPDPDQEAKPAQASPVVGAPAPPEESLTGDRPPDR